MFMPGTEAREPLPQRGDGYHPRVKNKNKKSLLKQQHQYLEELEAYNFRLGLRTKSKKTMVSH